MLFVLSLKSFNLPENFCDGEREKEAILLKGFLFEHHGTKKLHCCANISRIKIFDIQLFNHKTGSNYLVDDRSYSY